MKYKVFILSHWLGFMTSAIILFLMAYHHNMLHVLLLNIHNSQTTTGNYIGWLASLLFASILPAFSGWLMGLVVNKKKPFLPFKS